MQRQVSAGASVNVALTSLLTVLSLVIAAPASADDGATAVGGSNQSSTVAGPKGDVASEAIRDPPGPAPAKQIFRLWQWVELEPGHDKCKRRKAWPLPLWCYGSSSWPVLKAQAATARVMGIRTHSVSGTADRLR
jgi:hypothetical protein